MKTASFLALLSFISVAISSPVPSPYDILQHQNNDDPTGTSTVLHHMVNAEDRVLHIVHPDGTTHSMTLLPTSAIHSQGNMLSNGSTRTHIAPHVATVHYNATPTQQEHGDQHEFTSYTSHSNFAHPPQSSSNNSTPEPTSGLQQHKALGGPLTPSASLASHNSTMTHEVGATEKKSEGEEKKPASAPAAEKKAEEEKKGEEKKPEEEKKGEEKKPEEEKKGEEKKPEEEKKVEEKKGEEKKPEEEKKGEEKKPEEKKPEDDHPNGSFAKRDTIAMPVISLFGAAVGALFIL